MITKISPRELLHAKELEALGVPLDGEVLEKSQVARSALWIAQDPNIPQVKIFDLRSGGTGVFITLIICNDSDHAIRLDSVRLAIPWCREIRWLGDPLWKGPRRFQYWFPKDCTQRFDRYAVLNHQFGPKGVLLPEARLDGFLLGIGDEPMPACYEERQPFQARLVVFDGQRNEYPVNIKFLVRRERDRHQQQKAAEGLVAPRPVTRRRNITAEPGKSKKMTYLSTMDEIHSKYPDVTRSTLCG